MQMKRMTAKKVFVKDLIKGEFFRQGGFESNYVVTPYQEKVSRVRVLGTVVNKFISEDGNYGFFILDDNTETIRVKFFRETQPLEEVEIGSIIDLFGKVKEYNEEIYLAPEIIKKIKDPNWLTLRKLEISREREGMEKVEKKVPEKGSNEGGKRKIIGIIDKLDKKSGADYGSVLDSSDLEENETEEIINELLTEGTCYEPKPGKIKVLR